MWIYRLKDDIEQLETRIRSKENKISQLENQIEKQSIYRTLDENRFTSSEVSHYPDNYTKTEKDRVVEDKMIDLEDIINSIESTILAFEKSNTIHISMDKIFSDSEIRYGTIPTALSDFVQRLKKVDKVIESIIKRNLRRDSENSIEQFGKSSSYSPRIKDTPIGSWQREAEKLLPIADQIYEHYFTSNGSEYQNLKDSSFKDLFNLNHKIIKLLQQAENRSELECQKSEINKKVLNEVDRLFVKEGRHNLLQEIKSMNYNQNSDSNEIFEKSITLRKENITNSNDESNQILYARFEDTNAALERAFERISSLESENNKLIDWVNSEKEDKCKLQQEIDKISNTQKKMYEDREKVEMERVHARERLRVNNEHVDRIKAEKQELERRVKQISQMKEELTKILNEERQVYKDSKKLFEEEMKILKSSISGKVSVYRIIN